MSQQCLSVAELAPGEIEFDALCFKYEIWRKQIWGGGMSVCCKPRVQLFVRAGNGWPHSALRYH